MSRESPELLGLAYVSHSLYCIPCMCKMTLDSRYRIHELTNCTSESGLVLNSIMPQIIILSFHVAKTYQFWILLLHVVLLHCFQHNIHRSETSIDQTAAQLLENGWVPISLTKKYNIFQMAVTDFCSKFAVSWGFKLPIAT